MTILIERAVADPLEKPRCIWKLPDNVLSLPCRPFRRGPGQGACGRVGKNIKKRLSALILGTLKFSQNFV